MRILVVENDNLTVLGEVGEALAEAGAILDRRRPAAGDNLPADETEHDALVVMGGAQNALDDAASPYLPALVRLMRRFGDSGRSVLGICLGSQLLARAYGGKNRIGHAREFGWCDVELTPEGKTDPVLSAAPAAFAIFQWHDDTFTLPPGATRLANNDAASNQAFRIGRAAYGTQFHFEASTGVVDYWKTTFPDLIERRAPGWLAQSTALSDMHGPEADATGRALARAWVATIATGSRQARMHEDSYTA